MISLYELEYKAHKNKVLDIVWEHVSTLKGRERYVLVNRLGLEGGQKTLKEIGVHLGVGPERIRQLQARAFRRILGDILEDLDIHPITKYGYTPLTEIGQRIVKEIGQK